MKTISRILAALTAAAMLLLSCGRSNDDAKNPSSGFVDYVDAYTGGLISESSSVKIEFASTPDTSVPTDGLFSFSPSLKGEARWVGSKMIEFVPSEGQLKQGREYRGKFALDKIFEIGNPSLKTFEFSFRVAPKRASVVVDNVKILKQSPSEAAVCGRLMLSESLSEEDAAGMLFAEGDAGVAKISLKACSEPGIFEFTCSPVPRSTRDTKVNIVFDAHSSGFGKTVSSAVTIPGTGEFKVLSAKKKDGAEPFIEVVLSQPLDPLSDISGMFTLSGNGRSFATSDGNIVRVFYEKRNAPSDISLTVSGFLKDYKGNRLENDWTAEFRSDELKPAIRLPYQGNILPDASDLRLPFQAVNLNAVDIRIIKIYSDNVLHFLQENSLESGYEIRRSGRLVYSKKFRLDSNPQTNLHEWNNFSVDLSGLMKREKGAIYRVSLSFRQDYSLYGKEALSLSGEDEALTKLAEGEMTAEDEAVWDIPNSYYYDNWYDWELYEWAERDNPLHPSYYMKSDRFPSVNLMASNLGVIAKSTGEGKVWVSVNDIISASPLQGVEVTAYNYQLRQLSSAKTDSDGRAELSFKGKPFVIVAKSSDAVSYLKVISGQENSLSRFDVGGEKVEKGLRGFIYGERGVWRPGDTMHLVLLVESTGAALPQNHPAVLEVYNPQGQFFARTVCPKSTDGFYTFELPTAATDPTGIYHAYIKLGGVSFHKALHVESIKPNRLKIELSLPSQTLESRTTATFGISSSWLTGSAASSLPAKVSLKLFPRKTSFSGFDGYIFTNPLSDFHSMEMELFSTRLDSRGNASVPVRIPDASDAPGMLNATLVTRVMEPGGNESIISQSAICSPFSAYVGVSMPSTKDGYLETDTDWKIKLCAVDKNGRRVSGHNLEYRIYRLDNSWWWENSPESLSSYVRGSSAKVVSSGRLVSGTSDSEISFRLNYPDWGNFLLLVTDLSSGHSSGTKFSCDWPMWRGRADRGESSSASMLSFSLDRKSYSVGDEGVIYIPAAKGARALVSFENDSRVLSSTWVSASADSETAFRFKVTEDMAPNCYAHLTLLNPHSRTAEGQPLRMYGVQPVIVDNPASRLEPQLTVPDVIRPQEEFSVKVREKAGKQMTYTLAIVDEGLLDLTNFKTPDPWSAMNRRTALGMKTWDIYDNVVGAYGTSFASMFSVGGDEDVRVDGSVRDNRFEPVVRFLGPFSLKRGENVHKITLPMYVGSVRVMLVAAHDGAYGSAEKTAPVRSPLMVLSTLPRALGTDEKVTMPVNVFAMDDSVRDVKVSVSSSGPLHISGTSSQNLQFDFGPNASGVSSSAVSSSADKLVNFDFRTGDSEGVAQVVVKAVCGNYTAEETVNISVTNVNPYQLSVKRQVLKAGESCSFECVPTKPSGSAKDGEETYNILEVSSFPSIDINGVWLYMKYYPHSCTEQLCAKGITLLSILPLLDEERKSEANAIVNDILTELYSRQLSDGTFVLWSGGSYVNMWADAMAGHLLTLASNAGFSVNAGVFGAWRNKVKKYVNGYRPTGGENDDLAAYNLYILALSGNAQDGSMNRFRESSSLSLNARHLLASAYSLSGRKSVASKLLSDVSGKSAVYKMISDSETVSEFYGSTLRDDAIALEAQVLTGNLSAALSLAGSVAEAFAKQSYTTQTTAFASSALSRLYALTDKGSMTFKYESSFGSDGANSETVKSANTIWTRNVVDGTTSVKLTNISQGVLYVSLSSREAVPSGKLIEARSSGLSLSVSYSDLDGNLINPALLKQGTDFTAMVTVRNNSASGLRNLALSVKVPSGWEIYNSRLVASEEDYSARYTNCDIRDSEVLWYFDLPRGVAKTFPLRLSAAYLGEFVLPAVSCEAMYDNSIFANSASGIAKVVAASATGAAVAAVVEAEDESELME